MVEEKESEKNRVEVVERMKRRPPPKKEKIVTQRRERERERYNMLKKEKGKFMERKFS